MNFKLTSNLRQLLHLFLLAMIFIGCEKDNSPESENLETEESFKPEFTVVTINASKVQENADLEEVLSKIKLKRKNSINVEGKAALSTQYDFKVIKEQVNYIENQDGSYHSYTFPVVRNGNEDHILENLLVSLQADGTYKAFLLKYIKNKHEKTFKNITYVQIIDDDDLISGLFSKMSGYCITYIVRECTENNHDSVTGYGDCQALKETRTDFCPSSGGSGQTTGYRVYLYNTEGSTGGTGGSSTGAGSGQDPIILNVTEPMELPAIKVLNCIQGELTDADATLAFLTDPNNRTFTGQLSDFVEQNSCSDETKAFTMAAIEAMDNDGINDGEVDFDDNVILSKEFKDNVKLKCVYDKLAGDNNTLFKDTVGAFIDNPNVNLIFKVGNCSTGGAAGCTNSIYVAETGIITITTEETDVSSVEIAETILHESIHAELAKYVLEHDPSVDTNDKPRLFELYKFYRESGVPEKHIDHPYMALNYINPIAAALRQFDSNKYPLDYYKSFAWIGLEDFDVNGVLNDPLINTYEHYKATVIENSTICE